MIDEFIRQKINDHKILKILTILLVVAAIPLTVFLAQKQQEIRQRAEGLPITPPNPTAETSFTLQADRESFISGEQVRVDVLVRSDIDEANLFAVKLKFLPYRFSVIDINTDNTFIQNIIEKNYNYIGNEGTLSLVGGVPNPGYKTQTGMPAAKMATITFMARSPGQAGISFDDSSAIYRNSDNTNILTIKRGISSQITLPTPTPTYPPPSTPSPPPPQPSPDYSRVFVTSTTYDGNLGGLSGADAKCQERANAANLGGTWKAWLSDSTTSATSRLIHNIIPYVPAYGGTIANDWSDLTDGSLLASINVTELGTTNNAGWVWTGTSPDGSIRQPNDQGSCASWTSSSIGGTTGDARRTDGGWTDYGASACHYSRPIYCFEQTSFSPSPTSSPSPTPTTPPSRKGDGNRDGRIDLIDMSILLSYFSRSGFPPEIDMNSDGEINILDYSLLRTLLIENGTISRFGSLVPEVLGKPEVDRLNQR